MNRGKRRRRYVLYGIGAVVLAVVFVSHHLMIALDRKGIDSPASVYGYILAGLGLTLYVIVATFLTLQWNREDLE